MVDPCVNVYDYQIGFNTHLSLPTDVMLSMSINKYLRWLNTVLAVFEYRSFAKLWQEKGCSSQAETWQVKNILMKDFD